MAGLERNFEARHLQQMSTGANRLLRMLRVNADEIATEIARLQSKQLLAPEKYGKQLARNRRLLNLVNKNFIELEKNLYTELNSQTADQWQLANTKNNILVNNYIGEIPVRYANLNLDALAQFQKRNLGGLNLSERIHNLTELNQQLYNDYIGSGITQGRSSAAIARDLNNINSNPYNVKVFDSNGEPTTLKKISPVLQSSAKGRGIYRSPQKNLFRVTRTETNAAYRLGDYERFQQLDFVVGYRVHLSAAHNITDMCDFLAGPYPKKFVFTGWHPNCFCYVTSILKTKDEFRRGVASKNQVNKIPRSAQRYAKSVKNKNYYDWQKDNFKTNGVPYKKVGGPSSGIEPYKISTDPKDYRPKNKILRSAARGVV